MGEPLEGESNGSNELEACLGILAATRNRKGHLQLADIARVGQRRGLSATATARLIETAASRGLIDLDGEVNLPHSDDYAPTPDSSNDPLGMLFDSVRAHPILEQDEQRRLARLVRLADDVVEPAANEVDSVMLQQAETAREALILSNLRLVLWVVRNYQHLGLDLEDLMAEGYRGLMRAIDLFDPSLGTQLSTYAYYWIRQAVLRALANDSRAIRLPVHIQDRMLSYHRRIKLLRQQKGREPFVSEVAQEMGISVEEAAFLRDVSRPIHQLSELESHHDSRSAIELIQDPGATQPLKGAARAELEGLLHNVVATLEPRESDIIRRRFGLGDYKVHTLEEVGLIHGITRERVRQIEAKALTRLAHPTRSRILKVFLEE